MAHVQAQVDAPRHRDYQAPPIDARKTVRALAAFDAGGEAAPPAASPAIPLGRREDNDCIVEQIAYDPAFRTQDTPKATGRWDGASPITPRTSSLNRLQKDAYPASHQVIGNPDVDCTPGEKGARPRSSSTVSYSAASYNTQAHSTSHRVSSNSSLHETSYLPALQAKGHDEHDGLEPLTEEEIDPASFDLVVPANGLAKPHSLETQSELLFSVKHLAVIFDEPSLLQRFTNYLHAFRPKSVPLLVYYLNALKALRAVQYANAISADLEMIEGLDFTVEKAATVIDHPLREKANRAFEILANNDLPGFITQTYLQTVSVTIKRRIANTLTPELREQSEGLAEVFCLTDPSRPDNPIVFASEEFNRTTQYGMNYILGRNCRFLQGPKTNPFSVKRIREKLEAGKEHCETFLNYRRDGSPFMNLLMVAPLLDSRGIVRYHIGAQVDVSGLVKTCAGLESFAQLMDREDGLGDYGPGPEKQKAGTDRNPNDHFRELAEMLNLSELRTVRESGGILHRTQQDDVKPTESVPNWNRPRLLINDDASIDRRDSDPILRTIDLQSSGRLSGVYEHYLLVRPYPNLRVLFASPTLRVPGMLQSAFMDRIGGSDMVRDAITQAFAEGNGITAKVRWITRLGKESRGRPRWIHCTPLLGLNGAVGVWMVVLVNDENDASDRAPRTAAPLVSRPAVPPKAREDDQMSLASFAEAHRVER